MLKPQRLLVEPIIRRALLEDIGHGADITTDSILSEQAVMRARLVARKPGTLAGLDAALLAFSLLHDGVSVDAAVHDGEQVGTGTVIAAISGNARAILTGERTALNVLCRLSGIATATRQLVDLITGTHAKIVCTRKTTPGLRVLEKYAVRCGGGSNHRFGLDDAVLIKDNHLAVAGSIARAVAAVRANVGHLVKIEVEVDTLEQVRDALAESVDAVLLDNMQPEMLREAVAIVAGRCITEASGTIDAQRVAAVAHSGVDLISSGWITHSAPTLDIGLDGDV